MHPYRHSGQEQESPCAQFAKKNETDCRAMGWAVGNSWGPAIQEHALGLGNPQGVEELRMLDGQLDHLLDLLHLLRQACRCVGGSGALGHPGKPPSREEWEQRRRKNLP